jgi:hypothetical protein
MADLTQAAHLELALRALETRDLPGLIGALASLDLATLDHLTAVLSHPIWDDALRDYLPARRSRAGPRRY